MEEKRTTYKEVLKNNIISFLSYTISLGFIFILLTFFVKSTLQNTNVLLSITLSLISGILIFNLMHFIHKSSTLETFKNINLTKSDEKIFTKKMNLFFVICALISVLTCIAVLAINYFIFFNAIEQTYEKYAFISYEFADKVANYIREEYQNSSLNRLSSTIIIELSLVTSFLSLIPYQEKLLAKYKKT